MNELNKNLGIYILIMIAYVYLLTTETAIDAVHSFLDDLVWLVNNF